MTPKETRASLQTANQSQAKATTHRLPANPGRTFKRAAARANKVIALYDRLNPGIGRDCIMQNLLHDLMHLCNRDLSLGDFDEGHAGANYLYEALVEESEWMQSEGLVG